MANGDANMTASSVESVRMDGWRKNHSFCNDRRPCRAKFSSCATSSVYSRSSRRHAAANALATSPASYRDRISAYQLHRT